MNLITFQEHSTFKTHIKQLSSIVASEAAFSTGRRVLDPYRTRLSTPIVKALIYTKDQVRKSRTQIDCDDAEYDIKDDDIAKDIKEQLEKLTGRDKEKQIVKL